ncbi:hypothetical protein LX97_03471 [Nonlabens dokdonensis]|jgi:hypothetical protein|uniref:IrrE N-terminal-like domain-containing protein n=2 Tax=Nonlabens dokdonensis TaxID=328515 RepID=L7W8C9_NONDD|nr:hypothetical protein [Nonlabens dokdonensis]AGC77945.1 hypothetical protein DDD_2818 [Nonlabens dokdonensis DSW-6]PZX36237.1 hypothetical protein LX97_03471 [Nonlabens dokdonensis]
MIKKNDYSILLNELKKIGIIVDASNNLKHPINGQSDGLSIKIDCNLKIDDRFYILLHLFGHLLQPKDTLGAKKTFQIEIDSIERAIGYLDSIKLSHLKEYVTNRFKKDIQYFNDLKRNKTKYLLPKQVEIEYKSDDIILQLNPIKFKKHKVQKISLIEYL